LRADKKILEKIRKSTALDDEIEKSITEVIENIVKDFIKE